MNEAETKAYKAVRSVPHKKLEVTGREALLHAIELRFKRQAKARAERKARLEPAFKAIRAAVAKSPDLAALRGPIAKAMQASAGQYKHPRTSARSPKSPFVKLGSLQLVDVPPFQSLTGFNQNGIVTMQGPAANGKTGSMSFNLQAGGPNSSGTSGAGTVDCWAAVGQAYTLPASVYKVYKASLTFTVSPSVSWEAIWGSSWWREAAGSIWIGQVVNEFTPDGALVSTPVSTQHFLESFDDNNFSDSGNQNGSSSGIPLSSTLMIESDMLYECWAVVGGSATGDFSDSQSFAQVSIQATANPLTFDWRWRGPG
ncbi:MAG: hypothetical protein OK449_01130 [Thaumarchaeota archaeon]|nr:hypothetical protein [Nitrososphaerota archaeon]